MGLARRSEGPPDAPPVVLLHGLGGTMRAWDRVVPLLRDTHRLLLYDLPGFGASGGGTRTTSIEDQAAAVRDALAEDGVDEAVVAGHSMGGNAATALAEQAPGLVSHLIPVNAPATYASRLTARGAAERTLTRPVVGPLLWRLASESRLRAGLRTAFAPGGEVPDVFVEDMGATSWTAFAAGTTAVDAYVSEQGMGERLAALGVPATVVFGEQDERVDPASLSVYDGVANVRVVRIPEAGHTPVWETPEQIAELIAAARG